MSWALTNSSHPCLPLQWCFPRTCWRRAWKQTTLPCWDSETSSFQVMGPGRGPKWRGIPWRRSRPVRDSLTHQEREGGRVRLRGSLSPPARGLVKGVHLSPVWAGPRRDDGEQDCPHGASDWVNRHYSRAAEINVYDRLKYKHIRWQS